MLKKQIYPSKVFNDFKAINHRDAKAVVRFYHQNKANIHELRFYEAFVLQFHYTSALHHLGEYQRHLLEADNIIYLSIDNNIQYSQGEDVYQKTLFEKAKSYYFLEDFEKAKHIYVELIKIEPKSKRYAKGLREVLLKTENNYVENFLLSGIFTLLFSIGFSTLYLLLSDYMYDYRQVLMNIIVSSASLGWLLSVTGVVLERTILKSKIFKIQDKALKSKKQKVK